MMRLIYCFILMLVFSVALYAVPGTITYQGKLYDNGTPANGNYSLSFAIFDAETGGNQIWPASGFDSHSVAVENGLYTVVLGVSFPIDASIFSEGNAWIEAKANNSILPRIQLHNVPFALQAENLSTKGDNIGDLLMWNGTKWIPTQFKLYYRDYDGDSYGDLNFTIYTNNPLPGYVENSSDCDDKNNLIYPGAPEIVGDGKDNNCNGIIDETN